MSLARLRGSSESGGSHSSTCQVSCSSSESDNDDYDADSDQSSWLLDSGATNHFGNWQNEVAKGKPESEYRHSSNTLLGIGGKRMRAIAEGQAGPLRKVTFYKGLDSNLISAAKLCSDSNVSIIMTKTGMSLVHHDEAAKSLHQSVANMLWRTTNNGLYKVQLRRLDQVLYRMKSRRQHRQEVGETAPGNGIEPNKAPRLR